MNRFEIAETLMHTMETNLDHQSPYAAGLRAALAAVFSDDEPEPLAFEVGVEEVPRTEPGQNGWAVVRQSGEAWVVLKEVDEKESRAWPVVRLIRRSREGHLRFVGGLRPTVTYSEPGLVAALITYQWRTIREFEDDEYGIRDVFRSWVAPAV